MTVENPYKQTPKMLAILVAAAFAVSIGAAPALAQSATPIPGSGPSIGGTSITLPKPEGMRFSKVKAGSSFSLALGEDGLLYAWGGNAMGELGNGSFEPSDLPLPVSAPDGVTFPDFEAGMVAGAFYAVAIGSDGVTYAWGNNEKGQLGNGTTENSNVPVPVAAPQGVSFKQLGTGGNHVLAIGDDGNTYAWGDNGYGQLGDGAVSSQPRTLPQLVSLPSGVAFTKVSATSFSSAAMGSDGKIYTWGRGQLGELGNGTLSNRALPGEISRPAGASLSLITNSGSPVATGSDGKTYSWGYNSSGQLGNGTNNVSSLPTIVQLPEGVTLTEVGSSGSNFNAAIGTDGNAYTWGRNNEGELGNGDNSDSNIPQIVTPPSGVTFTHISAGYVHALAIGDDGKAYSWGANNRGQLGDGNGANRSVPSEAPEVTVKAVKIDGQDGDTLTSKTDGTFSTFTPAHAAGGPFDVVVEWTLAGQAQAPVTYPKSFTYTDGPFLTDPTDRSAPQGSSVSFSVIPGGFPTPDITWEFSSNNGQSWEPLLRNEFIHLSEDGQTLTLAKVTSSLSGNLYRATAVNIGGSVTSNAARLVVTVSTDSTDKNENPTPSQAYLASTGSHVSAPLLLAAVGLALLACGAFALILQRGKPRD